MDFRSPIEWFRRLPLGGRVLGVLLGATLLSGMAMEAMDHWTASRLFVRSAQGYYYGRLPGPAELGVVDELRNRVSPPEQYRLMTIRHIPRIKSGAGMPHPYVGPCAQCHLYQGGSGPGTQSITPVGKVLEQISRLNKLGPPLLPTSEMPHPAAGRCIKCHDIVIKVPLDKTRSKMRWVL